LQATSENARLEEIARDIREFKTAGGTTEHFYY
jgi:hypothetical protein